MLSITRNHRVGNKRFRMDVPYILVVMLLVSFKGITATIDSGPPTTLTKDNESLAATVQQQFGALNNYIVMSLDDDIMLLTWKRYNGLSNQCQLTNWNFDLKICRLHG